MSYQAVEAARNHRVGSSAWKAILLVIAEAAHADGRGCSLSYSTIAERSEAGLRTVKRAVPAMVEAGVLVRDGRRCLGVVLCGPVDMRGHHGPTVGATLAPADGATMAPSATTAPNTGATLAPQSATTAPDGATMAPKPSTTHLRTVKPNPAENGQSNELVLAAQTMSPTATEPVEVVFDAWRESTGKHRAQLSADRRKVIARALKAYPVSDLVDAVGGWRLSAHHRGENESHTVYNDLELLLRDAKRIEKFRDLARGSPSERARFAEPRGWQATRILEGRA